MGDAILSQKDLELLSDVELEILLSKVERSIKLQTALAENIRRELLFRKFKARPGDIFNFRGADYKVTGLSKTGHLEVSWTTQDGLESRSRRTAYSFSGWRSGQCSSPFLVTYVPNTRIIL